MGTVMCSYNPESNKEIEYVHTDSNYKNTNNNKNKHNNVDYMSNNSKNNKKDNKQNESNEALVSPKVNYDLNKYDFNDPLSLGISKEDLKRNLNKQNHVTFNELKYNEDNNIYKFISGSRNSTPLKYLNSDQSWANSPKFGYNINIQNDENLDFYKIFTPSTANKLVISKRRNFGSSNKSIKEEDNESNKFRSSLNSKGFEEAKLRRALNNRSKNQFEEAKNSSNSPNSKFKSPQNSKNNQLNSANQENSFLNFLENNSFVKLNRKKLKKDKPHKELIVPIANNKQTNIQKELIFNENQLVLNYQKINELDSENVIYDFEFDKLNIIKGEYKPALKYAQITKGFFKYFNSQYSSSVWKDRPLMRLPLNNIEKIVICENLKYKKKNLEKINVVVQIYLIFNENFNYDTKYEITKQTTESKTDFLIEIGLETKEKALTLVKIIYFVRKVLNRRYLSKAEENNNDNVNYDENNDLKNE